MDFDFTHTRAWNSSILHQHTEECASDEEAIEMARELLRVKSISVKLSDGRTADVRLIGGTRTVTHYRTEK